MSETINPTILQENQNKMNLYKSKHPGRLLPTASTFGPLPNFGGEEYHLPVINENKKGCFAFGKLSYDPLQKKKILGLIIRTNTK